MKFVSWNVNGLRACVNKGFKEFFEEVNADIFAIQETKMQPDQLDLQFEGYTSYFNSAVKKGYSGVAIYTKQEPMNVYYGIGIEEHDQEGRVITLEYEDFYFVTCYTPNSQKELARLAYRMQWEDAFQDYIDTLKAKKKVYVCGDLNVAHNEIDLKNPKSNRMNAGFSDEERAKMTQFLNRGYIDTYRYFYPDVKDVYSWWSYMFKSREKNIGWRIDYFLASDSAKDTLVDAKILMDVMGSDHCPVVLEIQ